MPFPSRGSHDREFTIDGNRLAVIHRSVAPQFHHRDDDWLVRVRRTAHHRLDLVAIVLCHAVHGQPEHSDQQWHNFRGKPQSGLSAVVMTTNPSLLVTGKL